MAETIASANVANGAGDRRDKLLVVGTSFYNFLATVEAVSAHVVATMGFTRGLVHRKRGSGQRIV
jgi:hypothetical protein